MNSLIYIVFFLCTIILRNQNIDTNRKTNKYIYKQINKRRCGPHRRQRLTARITANYDHVRSIKQ